MAFILRVEFWKVSQSGDGIGAIVLDEAVADALEFESATVTPIDVPVNASRSPIAMSVDRVSGSSLIQKMSAGATQNADRAKRVAEGTQHWFIVRPGDRLFVSEYVV